MSAAQPSASAHLGEGSCSPLTTAPVDDAPPATSATASRDQAQREGCHLPSILGSKGTVTARPGPAPPAAGWSPLGGKAPGAHPVLRPEVIWDWLVVAVWWPCWEGSMND